MVFNSSIRHEITSKPHPSHDKIWTANTFLRCPEDLTLPSIPDGTEFKVTLLKDVDMDSEAAVQNARFFNMRTIGTRDNDAAFVLEWQEEKDKEVPFGDGYQFGVTLNMVGFPQLYAEFAL